MAPDTKTVYCTIPERFVTPIVGNEKFSNLNFTFKTSLRELDSDICSGGVYQILWIGLGENLTRDIIDQFPNLQAVLTSTTGTTHLDMEELQSRGVTVISLKDMTNELGSITTTPELAWGLFIAAHRKILIVDRKQHFASINRQLYFAPQISNQKIGIIGFGRIGKIISKYAIAFGAETYYFDVKSIPPFNSCHATSFDWIIENCDAIFVCASKDNLAESPILGLESISRLKSNAIIVNTSRGSLVDEKCILESLKLGRIRGYATDVLQMEEIVANSMMTQRDINSAISQGLNLIVTPHIGGASEEAIIFVNSLVLDRFLEEGI